MKRLILFLLCCCIYISIQAQTYSTINALNSGQWSNPSNWDINGVPPEPIPPGATVNINHWISIYSGTVTNNGTINVNAGQRLYNLATLTNNNLINVSGILIPSTGSTATNNSQGATINILNSGSMQTDSDVNVIFNNDGTFNNAGFVLNSITFNNNATGVINNNSTTFGSFANYQILNNLGTINNNGAGGVGQLVVYGQGTVNAAPNAGNIYSATGTINSTLAIVGEDATIVIPELVSDGDLYPGFNSGIGSFTIDGNFSGSGTMWFTINGPTADTEHDQLIVTGTSNVSAQGLWVSLGYTPPVGAFFDIIMSAGGVTGPFSWSYLPSLGAGKAWEIQYLADRIRLLVIDPNAPPEPECTTYLFNLNNSLADETNTVSLTSNGGTLGATNYSFGPNQGPSLSNVLGDTYTIEMRFTLDDVSGYSKLIDFKNLTSDNGLYFLSMWTK